MTLLQAQEFLKLKALAESGDAVVEYRWPETTIGDSVARDRGFKTISPSYFNWDDAFSKGIELRLKPSPKFRAWKACEAQVGKLIVDKSWRASGPSSILGACDSGVLYFDLYPEDEPRWKDMSYVLEHCLWAELGTRSDTTDGWHVCGVEE